MSSCTEAPTRLPKTHKSCTKHHCSCPDQAHAGRLMHPGHVWFTEHVLIAFTIFHPKCGSIALITSYVITKTSWQEWECTVISIIVAVEQKYRIYICSNKRHLPLILLLQMFLFYPFSPEVNVCTQPGGLQLTTHEPAERWAVQFVSCVGSCHQHRASPEGQLSST